MDFGAGFKNGVLLLTLIIAVHIIMTKPDAIQNLMMHSVELTPHPPGEAMLDPPAAEEDHDSDLIKFVYSDEDRGALDKFFRSRVVDPRLAEGADIVQHAHLKAGDYGIQDASFLKIPHEERSAPAHVAGLDTFAADFSCPV